MEATDFDAAMPQVTLSPCGHPLVGPTALLECRRKWPGRYDEEQAGVCCGCDQDTVPPSAGCTTCDSEYCGSCTQALIEASRSPVEVPADKLFAFPNFDKCTPEELTRNPLWFLEAVCHVGDKVAGHMAVVPIVRLEKRNACVVAYRTTLPWTMRAGMGLPAAQRSVLELRARLGPKRRHYYFHEEARYIKPRLETVDEEEGDSGSDTDSGGAAKHGASYSGTVSGAEEVMELEDEEDGDEDYAVGSSGSEEDDDKEGEEESEEEERRAVGRKGRASSSTSHKAKRGKPSIASERRVHSVIPYMGGKSQAVRMLSSHVHPGTHTLVSPFIGGGSFEFFWLDHHKQGKLVAADMNAHLINMYQQVHTNAEAVLGELSARVVTKERFADCKAMLQQGSGSAAARAAAKILLHSVSFNSQGRAFSASKSITHACKTVAAADYSRVQFAQRSWAATLQAHPPAAGVFLYLDPPYVEKEHYYESAKGGFGHAALAEALRQRGADDWLLSYQDHPLVRQLYGQWCTVIEVPWQQGSKSGVEGLEVLIRPKPVPVPVSVPVSVPAPAQQASHGALLLLSQQAEAQSSVQAAKGAAEQQAALQAALRAVQHAAQHAEAKREEALQQAVAQAAEQKAAHATSELFASLEAAKAAVATQAAAHAAQQASEERALAVARRSAAQQLAARVADQERASQETVALWEAVRQALSHAHVAPAYQWLYAQESQRGLDSAQLEPVFVAMEARLVCTFGSRTDALRLAWASTGVPLGTVHHARMAAHLVM